MNNKQYLVGLDVGTTKVCSLIGTYDSKGDLDIIGIGSHPSEGLKKGSVVNIEKTIRSIRASVEEAKMMSGVDIKKACVGIAGNHIYSFNSTGVVAIKNSEITQSDVDRVIEAAKAVVIPSDREILHVIPREFRVDNTRGIKNPIGMCGVRLEVHVHIVTGMTPLIQNLLKCVGEAGIRPDGIILQPIASSKSVLSEEERDLGVVLVDIGGGTTDIAVWKEGSLIHSHIIPIGGNHFTNDLAVALKVPHKEAERVKTNHGSVLAEMINQSTKISVQGIAGTKSRDVPASIIAKVLGARGDELFNIIRDILEEKELMDEVTGGVVLTGGGALIAGLPELAEYILQLPVKIGNPQSFGGMTSVIKDPRFSTVLGLLMEDAEKSKDLTEDEIHIENSSDIVSRLGDSLRNVFKEIF